MMIFVVRLGWVIFDSEFVFEDCYYIVMRLRVSKIWFNILGNYLFLYIKFLLKYSE